MYRNSRALVRLATAATAAILAASTLLVSPAHATPGSPVISIGSGSIVEGQMTHRYIKFVATLSWPTSAVVTVQFATADDTATAATHDYRAKSGTLTFKPFQTAKPFAIVTLPDQVNEPDEQFTVTLSNPQNASPGNMVGVGTIFDDDPNVGPRVSLGDTAVYETCAGHNFAASLVMTLSLWQSGPIVVQVTSSSGSATSGIDFKPFSKTITFTASQILKEIKIQIIPDTNVEGDESFSVDLNIVSGTALALKSHADVVIHDCDPT